VSLGHDRNRARTRTSYGHPRCPRCGAVMADTLETDARCLRCSPAPKESSWPEPEHAPEVEEVRRARRYPIPPR
jgi:tRNA(Ile2) C34 agmatinyltransferase TiaS